MRTIIAKSELLPDTERDQFINTFAFHERAFGVLVRRAREKLCGREERLVFTQTATQIESKN